MRDDKGFDLWANDYDKSVGISEDSDQYPFAGYKGVLNGIYNRVREKTAGKILDIGFGTGTLTARLYNDGYDIYGIDFSSKMIEIARVKMPGAELYHYDFSKGLPKALTCQKFDFILSTYAMHHLSNEQKITFIHELWEHLEEDGEILIGDVAFDTKDKLTACKNLSSPSWDDDEIYIVFSELVKSIPFGKPEFFPISHCAGIISISKRKDPSPATCLLNLISSKGAL